MHPSLTEPPPDNQLWADEVYETLKRNSVKVVAYVPDGGHRRLIERSIHDPGMHDVLLTSEQEGVGICAGADLGLGRGVLLMQSSGVGNCVNAFSLLETAAFPFLTLVSMRGDFGEQNPWQNPMGQAVDAVLRALGIQPMRVERAAEVVPMVENALQLAFGDDKRVAVLLTQKLMGAKQF